MSGDRWIVIRGWEKFQHRDATRRTGGLLWHKVYTELLHRDEYLELTLGARGLLHGLWLLAGARHADVIAEDTATSHLTYTRSRDRRHLRRHLEALEQAGFITITASKPASSPASDPASLEVEVEKKDLQGPSRTTTGVRRAPSPKKTELGQLTCTVCPLRLSSEGRLRDHLENVHWLEGDELEQAIAAAVERAGG